MDTITAILIDDEISSLKGLEKKIKILFPDIILIGAFQNPEDAILSIEKQQPNLLFLDIEMPRMTGFELLSKLKKVTAQVIFITAYNVYAVEAFKKSAIDYILKPIDDKELIEAINKALSVIKNEAERHSNLELIQFLTKQIKRTEKIIIPTEKGLLFVAQNEILHLEGFDGYTKIHRDNTTEIISSYNIGKYEKMLQDNFFKCHKSHIVNLHKVSAFENEGYIVLENQKRVPVSKTNRKKLTAFFK